MSTADLDAVKAMLFRALCEAQLDEPHARYGQHAKREDGTRDWIFIGSFDSTKLAATVLEFFAAREADREGFKLLFEQAEIIAELRADLRAAAEIISQRNFQINDLKTELKAARDGRDGDV